MPETCSDWASCCAFQTQGSRGATPQPCLTLPHTAFLLTYLGIRLVLEGIKDFLEGHDLAGPLIHRLPHDALGLGRRAVSLLGIGPSPARPDRPLQT